MKKIGIVTLYGNYNLGNKLQNYAVEQIYRNLGFDSYTIFYTLDEMEATGNSKQKIKKLVKEVLLKIGIRAESIYKYSLEKKRNRLFKVFSDNFLNLSEEIHFSRLPSDLKDHYDFFSVGSDQVWRNWTDTIDEMKYFLLSFADPNQRICFSPSIGRSEIPDQYLNTFKKELEKFSILSCRENSGAELISNLTGRGVHVLSDPTIGIKADEWLKISVKPEFPIPEEFILVYFLGEPDEKTTNEINELSGTENLPIVNIYDKNAYPEYYICGPSEFLYLVSHAKLVCTNSFHGCVFSILFNTDFICYKREDHRADMTDRIQTLLDKYGLPDRLSSNIDCKNIFSADFSNANMVLVKERDRLYEYILEAVN